MAVGAVGRLIGPQVKAEKNVLYSALPHQEVGRFCYPPKGNRHLSML